MRGPVVLTASAGSFPGLAERLRELPVTVEERPLLRFAPPADWAPLDTALDAICGMMSRAVEDDADRDVRSHSPASSSASSRAPYAAIAFTSPRGARAFADRLGERRSIWATSRMVRPELWAVGAGTARALGEDFGPLRMPEEREVGRHGAAAALARAMQDAGIVGPVLFPCGDHRRDELPAQLREAGIHVEEVIAYRLVLASERDAREAAEHAGVIVVASPSVAGLLGRACPAGTRPPLLAVGPVTAAASLAAGWPPSAVAPSPTTAAVDAAARALLQ